MATSKNSKITSIDSKDMVRREKVVPMSYSKTWGLVAELLRLREEYSGQLVLDGLENPRVRTLSTFFRDIESRVEGLQFESGNLRLGIAACMVPGLAKIYSAIVRGHIPWVETVPNMCSAPQKSTTVLSLPREEISQELLSALEQIKTDGFALHKVHEKSIEHLVVVAFVRHCLKNCNIIEISEKRICKYLCRKKDEISPCTERKLWERYSKSSQCISPVRTADWSLANLFRVNERAIMKVRTNKRKVQVSFCHFGEFEDDVESLIGVLKYIFKLSENKIRACLEVLGYTDISDYFHEVNSTAEIHEKKCVDARGVNKAASILKKLKESP